MNGFMKTVLSLSISGSILILALFLCKRLFQNKFSRKWQYYIWLIAIARLLLPVAPEVNLTNLLFQQAEQAVIHADPQTPPLSVTDTDYTLAAPTKDTETPVSPALSVPEIGGVILQNLWQIWLGVALILLIRKITVYQGFVKYVRAGGTAVSDIALLDELAQIGEQLGVKRPVELYVNHVISSPLLIGFLRPCIVLPAVLPEPDFQYTVRHELTHYIQRDMFYKWLAQITICLHWFNPLVWLMGREINRACELACDEAVIRPLGESERRAYGDTLLRAMGVGGGYKNSVASVTLHESHESAEILKERLKMIMNFKKTPKLMAAASFALAAVLMMGAASAGAYTGAERRNVSQPPAVSTTAKKDLSAQAEKYYKAKSLPLFKAVFARMDEKNQKAWLEKIYQDGQTAFFSAALNALDSDSSLPAAFAEKAYQDKQIALFSILANNMSEKNLENWLDRALDDGRSNFQSVLFNLLDRDDELDELEEALAQKQMDEYQAYNITKKGKNYYYKNQLTYVFLDVHNTGSFSCYTLEVNPNGQVSVKVSRDKNDKITGVAVMSDTEVKEFLDGKPDQGIPKESVESVSTAKDKNNDFDWDWDWDFDWDWDDDKNKEDEDKELTAEYASYGITQNGKSYYYKNKLVYIFLDQRANSSFYRLNVDPKGSVSVKISRGEDGKIKSVAEMPQAEVNELLGDMYDMGNMIAQNYREITVPVDISRIKSGEYVWLGTYTLDEGDRVYYDVSAETGEQMDVGFARPGQKSPDTKYQQVSCRKQDEKLEVISGPMVWKNPVAPGEYSLFVHTNSGLTGAAGEITIVKAELSGEK